MPENSYLQKEKNLINAIKSNNGAPLFDSAGEGYDFIDEYLKKFAEYVSTVVEYERAMPALLARYGGEELKEKISETDSRRHAAHEAAISAVNIINRACQKLGLPPFADIDTADRRAVAEFCGDYVREVFSNGVNEGH